MAMPDYASVDAYIAAQREDVRPLLTRLRTIIRKAIPRVEESISYRIPTYKLHGKAVVFFAAWKAHLSLYPATPAVFAAIPELVPLKQAKDTLRLDFAKPLPHDLIARFAKLRAEQVERERSADGGAQKVAPKKAASKKAAPKNAAPKKAAPTKAAPKKATRAAR